MSTPEIVCDTGPLIALARCNCLNLLTALFSPIHIPQAVQDEVTADHTRPDARAIADFANTRAHVHVHRNDAMYKTASRTLDEGEAQALSLAHTLGCAVLMDERLGRKVAHQFGIPIFGVLGVLLQAKRIGKIPHVLSVLEHMQDIGYRIAPALIEKVLTLAGEENS